MREGGWTVGLRVPKDLAIFMLFAVSNDAFIPFFGTVKFWCLPCLNRPGFSGDCFS